MSGSEEEAYRTVERVARESYGRLVAYFSVHTRDLAGAEEAYTVLEREINQLKPALARMLSQ